MTDKEKRAARREQQSREVETSQNAMRDSIAETNRLVGESDAMLRRHRQEREDDDKADNEIRRLNPRVVRL
jgi:hypothetical protein